MYANLPNASAATAPLSPLPQHQHAPQAPVQHGLPQGMPPAGNGGSHGMHQHGIGARAQSPAAAARAQGAAAFVTGAYQASGDPAIDRMIRLEAACKRFGSPI